MAKNCGARDENSTALIRESSRSLKILAVIDTNPKKGINCNWPHSRYCALQKINSYFLVSFVAFFSMGFLGGFVHESQPAKKES